MGWILSGMMLLVLAGIVILNLFRGKNAGLSARVFPFAF